VWVLSDIIIVNLFKLLAVLYLNSLEAMAAATTVRPYKFGFTIEEQQHRSEKRGEGTEF